MPAPSTWIWLFPERLSAVMIQARGFLTKPFSRLFIQDLPQASSQITADNLVCFSHLQLSHSSHPHARGYPPAQKAARAMGATSPEGLTYGSRKPIAHTPGISNRQLRAAQIPFGMWDSAPQKYARSLSQQKGSPHTGADYNEMHFGMPL